MITFQKNSQTIQISYKLVVSRTFLSRLRGLMFRRSFINEAMLLSPCNSIHTFFMLFPIDVLFLDRSMRIVHLCESLQPWRIILPVPSAYTTLELPAGTIQKYRLTRNALLEFQY
ncbi:DUF192 domain-containing protein [Fodinisporobacter ferrooxydans]|uniref:DUF192 domain-containing protein n=1 Tax=Fodinisporobacter ferrooxydans TaxID=2901836 RepID=A0ABY4CMS3_9BACL|nr:DUF192 domain-containing protein [Alicyclobacillaceae bacterium MYW30-H2]